jgi:FtsP/CotA-like multicopper oxidase with cupredoxin domain
LEVSRRHILLGASAAACAAISASADTQGSAGATRILRAGASGYDGMMPGPPLQIRRGEELRLRLVNELAEPTAVHWHGVRLVNSMDGAPPLTQPAIAPGDSFDYQFSPPDAGTYWYHSPAAPRHGLYGALIVDETEPVDVDRDLTLIFASTASGGGADQSFTVNSSPHADILAKGNERLRLRLLNASDSEFLELRVVGLRAFVMATDGQPTEPFAAREGRLSLGPGNRIDVFIDCTLNPGGVAPVALEGAAGTSPIARIVCQTGAVARTMPRPDPPALPPNSLPERMDLRGALRAEAVIRAAALQGNERLFAVKRGRTVVLKFSNTTLGVSFIHLHGHSFRLLDALDDGWKPFWLDTMPLAPQSSARIAFVADNPGKWVIEGLAGLWFEVT